MTRIPRMIDYVDNFIRHLRARVPAGLSRKTMTFAGAGLALAGVAGAAAAAGLLGHAAAAGTKHAIAAKRTAQAQDDETWAAVARIVASTTIPKPRHAQLPAPDVLTPAGTSGPQTSMAITPARYANAKTIVRQAIAKHMGLRSAVIAVATSMQESTLLNLSYGDRDSLGLFQQRPSSGWGTPAQIHSHSGSQPRGSRDRLSPRPTPDGRRRQRTSSRLSPSPWPDPSPVPAVPPRPRRGPRQRSTPQAPPPPACAPPPAPVGGGAHHQWL